MTETEWLAATDPKPMLARFGGRTNARKLRLFAVACAQRIAAIRGDEEAQKGLVIAELFADGLASKPQLRNASHSFIRKFYYRDSAYCALHKAASTAASGSSQIAAHVIAQIAVIPFGEPEDIETIQKRELVRRAGYEKERLAQVALVRDIFGNPFRPVTVDPAWLTSTVVALAVGIYADRAFDRLPILADALQDAGCDHADILTHCRSDGPHVRGCWVVDLLLRKS